MNVTLPPADQELVRQAQAGKEWAYTKLVDRHQAGVHRLMHKLVHNEWEAEDLTQEAFCKAFSKIDKYVPQYAFTTWLYRIATNNGIDYLRRQRLSLYSLDGLLESNTGRNKHFPASQPNAEQQLIREQRHGHLRAMVAQLSPSYQRMIELRYFEELSYEEIAELSGMPLGTVKAQLFRAKARLRQWLAQASVSS
ncbi:MAG: sigma-70 family RNA polymerase sigma factor [Bacteroidota bacterium]